VVNPLLLVRRLTLTAGHVVDCSTVACSAQPQQLDLFAEPQEQLSQARGRRAARDKERRLMETTLALKKRFGKNILLKGLNFADGATQIGRNNQIGGHKA